MVQVIREHVLNGVPVHCGWHTLKWPRNRMRILALLLLFGSASGYIAASDPARIDVTVTDRAGGTWADATVALINTKTLGMQKARTDSKGEAKFKAAAGANYVLIASPPSRYRCAESSVKTVLVKSAREVKVELTIGLEPCGVVE